MRRRTLLERSLGAFVGGILGGFVTLSLALSVTAWHWLLWSPLVMGALVGYWGGDRGLKALLRAAWWTK